MASSYSSLAKLLIVEDSVEDQEFFRQTPQLTDRYHLHFASCGEDALALLTSKSFDCILLDYQLPDRDGVSLCSEFTRKPSVEANLTPIIVVTGQSTERVVIEFLRVGAADYLTKGSFSTDMLLRTIGNAIGRAADRQKIKEQQRALECKERALRDLLEMELKSVAHLRSVFEGAPAGIVSLDSKGIVLRANKVAAAFFAQKGSDLSGRSVVSLSPHFKQDLLNRCYESLESNSVTPKIQVVVPGRDGLDTVIWQISCCAIRTRTLAEETAIGVSLFFQDVTDFVVSQSQLVAALQAKSDLICSASHELKTPISGISLAMQSFRRKLSKGGAEEFDRARLIGLADQTLIQLEKIVRLVDDMFDYSSISSGKLRIFKARTNISVLVADVLTRFTNAKKQEESIFIDAIQAGLHAQVDPLRIEQVLSNFLSNAVRYAPKSEITVRLEGHSDGDIRVSVSDRGPGIAPSRIAHVFSKFERCDPTQRAQGLGLGLYIAKQIIEQHEGEIGVESQVGRGCTFFFALRNVELRV